MQMEVLGKFEILLRDKKKVFLAYKADFLVNIFVSSEKKYKFKIIFDV